MNTRRGFIGGLLAAILSPRAEANPIYFGPAPEITRQEWDEMIGRYERLAYDLHLKFLGALVKPTLGYDFSPSRHTQTVELIRATRPEAFVFDIITDEAVRLYKKLEEMEARLINLRLGRRV